MELLLSFLVVAIVAGASGALIGGALVAERMECEE